MVMCVMILHTWRIIFVSNKQIKAMKTKTSSTMQEAMQFLFPDLRSEVSSFIQSFDLEIVTASRK